jgi:hypothetical protein
MDAEGPHLGGDRFREALDGELRGAIERAALAADHAADRRDVEHPARALGAHGRQHGAGHLHQAEDIGVVLGAGVGGVVSSKRPRWP